MQVQTVTLQQKIRVKMHPLLLALLLVISTTFCSLWPMTFEHLLLREQKQVKSKNMTLELATQNKALRQNATTAMWEALGGRNTTSVKPESVQIALKALADSFESNGGVNFVQIGANDGDSDNCQRMALRSTNWHSVMLEPVPHIFEMLKNNSANANATQRTHLMNAAVADGGKDAEMTFYSVNSSAVLRVCAKAPHWTLYEVGSFQQWTALNAVRFLRDCIMNGTKQEFYNASDYVSQTRVRTLTPETVLRSFVESGKSARNRSVDVLMIDTEGFDYKVLRAFLIGANIRPFAIIYEHKVLKANEKTQAISLLQNKGYRHFEVGENVFAVTDK